MQEQVEKVVTGNDDGDLPAEMVAEIKAAGAVIMVGLKGSSLDVVPSIAGGEYRPEHNAVHAYVAAVVAEHPNLIRRVNGVPTDADRYRALRTFAMLATADKARFDDINEQFQQLEQTLPEPETRTEAQHDAVADFLAYAILESEPVLAAPTTEPAGAVILPHKPVLAKPH